VTSAGPDLDDDAEDLYDNAPCGYLSTLADGTIARVNATLLGWLGHGREELVGRHRLSDLLTVGGRIYYETHLAPLLVMQGEVGGIALDLRTAGGDRLPTLCTFVVRPGDDGAPRVIRCTVFDARDRRAYEQELLRARKAADRDRERLQQLVASLQRSLLPATLPAVPGVEAAAHYHMASVDEVGGDFYDLFQLGEGRWAFLLGDVCGKGVEAAAVTATARHTLRAAALLEPDPAAALGHLNTILCQQRGAAGHRHCTVVFGLLEAVEGGQRVTVTTGGHPPPLLIRAGGTADPLPSTGGPLVGFFPDAAFATRTVCLAPGDTLLLYTDGLTEARTGTGRYGTAALLAFARERPAAGAAATVEAIVALLDTLRDGLGDDVAVMALGIPAAR
jgi:phosphoserine phosphatase RsbU/P